VDERPTDLDAVVSIEGIDSGCLASGMSATKGACEGVGGISRRRNKEKEKLRYLVGVNGGEASRCLSL
jgi:hypothetical protein